MDELAFYSDKEIESLVAEFQKPENKDKIILPITESVYVSWHELVREWRRRQDQYSL